MANYIYNGYDKVQQIFRFTEVDAEENIIAQIKIAKTKVVHVADLNGNPVLQSTIVFANKDEALADYLNSIS